MKNKIQINDICPNCKSSRLQYYNQNLICVYCKNTFSINYKQMHYEELHSLTLDTIDFIEEKLKEKGYNLPDDLSDNLLDSINEILEPLSTGDYRNYN
jgi:hypothetical protein